MQQGSVADAMHYSGRGRCSSHTCCHTTIGVMVSLAGCCRVHVVNGYDLVMQCGCRQFAVWYGGLALIYAS